MKNQARNIKTTIFEKFEAQILEIFFSYQNIFYVMIPYYVFQQHIVGKNMLQLNTG